jgi:hypothetical protein
MIPEKQEEKTSSEFIQAVLDQFRSGDYIDVDIACDALGQMDISSLETRQIKKIASTVTFSKLRCNNNLITLFKVDKQRYIEITDNIRYQQNRFAQEWKERKKTIFSSWIKKNKK